MSSKPFRISKDHTLENKWSYQISEEYIFDSAHFYLYKPLHTHFLSFVLNLKNWQRKVAAVSNLAFFIWW